MDANIQSFAVGTENKTGEDSSHSWLVARGGGIVKVLTGEWDQLRCKFIGSFSTPPTGCYQSSYLSSH